MSDELLLAFGCVITFIAVGGAYVALRSGFAHGWVSRHETRTAALREAHERLDRLGAARSNS